MAKFFDIHTDDKSSSHPEPETPKKDEPIEVEHHKIDDAPVEKEEEKTTPVKVDSDDKTKETDDKLPSEVHHQQEHSHPDELLSKAPEIPRATPAMAPEHHRKHNLPNITLTQFQGPKKQKVVTAVLSVILIILLALLVSQAVIFFNQSKKSTASGTQPGSVQIDASKYVPSVTPSASASASPSASASASASPAPSASASASATPAKSSINIRVLNGGGVTGAASKVATLIKNAGYNVTGTANAKTYTYATTEVLYKTADQKSTADDVASALTGYTVSTKQDAATVGTASDLLVIVGKK